jgi:hypothetical protein
MTIQVTGLLEDQETIPVDILWTDGTGIDSNYDYSCVSLIAPGFDLKDYSFVARREPFTDGETIDANDDGWIFIASLSISEAKELATALMQDMFTRSISRYVEARYRRGLK